jgi:hypothetical protein
VQFTCPLANPKERCVNSALASSVLDFPSATFDNGW